MDTVHVNARNERFEKGYGFLENGEAVLESRNAYFTGLEEASKTGQDKFQPIEDKDVNPKSMGFDIAYWGNSGIPGYLAPRF